MTDEELIENIADEISGIVVGEGYYSQTIGINAALEAAKAIAPILNRVRAESLREAAGDLFASAKGSAALQRARDKAEGVAPIGTSTPNEAEWYQMGNWARSTLLAFADRIEQSNEGNEP